MPTYLNSGTEVVTIGYTRIEPGQTAQTYEWLPVLPAGITKTSDAPFIDPAISSEKVTGTKTISVPSTVIGNYEIKIYVATGDVTFKLNSSSGTAIVLGLYDTFIIPCLSRTVDNIIITAITGNTYVTITKI